MLDRRAFLQQALGVLGMGILSSGCVSRITGAKHRRAARVIRTVRGHTGGRRAMIFMDVPKRTVIRDSDRIEAYVISPHVKAGDLLVLEGVANVIVNLEDLEDLRVQVQIPGYEAEWIEVVVEGNDVGQPYYYQ